LARFIGDILRWCGDPFLCRQLYRMQLLERIELITLSGMSRQEDDAAAKIKSTDTRAEEAAVGRTVRLVAVLNLAYFGVEFGVALAIGSVALFADSIDFLEDASINGLILLALGWSAPRRARVGMLLAGILLLPSVATVWTAVRKFLSPAVPAPLPLSLAGAGALAINFSCALMLARYRRHGGSLTRAAFLSSRNDVLANIAIIAAGLVTALWWRSHWPDLAVGVGILVLNAGAAVEVYRAARSERRGM
jgi:Co/Zn/Cd efflux system component